MGLNIWTILRGSVAPVSHEQGFYEKAPCLRVNGHKPMVFKKKFRSALALLWLPNAADLVKSRSQNIINGFERVPVNEEIPALDFI